MIHKYKYINHKNKRLILFNRLYSINFEWFLLVCVEAKNNYGSDTRSEYKDLKTYNFLAKLIPYLKLDIRFDDEDNIY
jgi:hypothetical protein